MFESQEPVLVTSHVPLPQVFHLVPLWPSPGPRDLGFKVDGEKEIEAVSSQTREGEREPSRHQAGMKPRRG